MSVGAAVDARTAGGRRRQQRGLRRAGQILDAAEELIAAFGVDAVGMNAIARQAGASPGTLYQYFPHKRAVFDGLLQRFAEELRSRTAVAPRVLDGRTGAATACAVDGVLRPVMTLAQSRPALLPLLRGAGVGGEPNALFQSLASRLTLVLVPDSSPRPPEPVSGELATRFLVQGVAVALRCDGLDARTAVLAQTRAAILASFEAATCHYPSQSLKLMR
ncbi:helix-turn-helix domain containing protein [Streptomyces coacervatus]|nr:helix-turn-helix domain-containing protein [Streptomyces coacervatus]MDF2269725.1 helix-turn-helix domain containing protein [Streptomyces coacervatus]